MKKQYTLIDIEIFCTKCLNGIHMNGNADTIQTPPITFNVIILLQLRVQRGKQNRIPVEPKLDGRGIPGEAYNQLGRDPVGKTTVRAVDD